MEWIAGLISWKTIEVLTGIGGLLWSIFGPNKEAEEAARRAEETARRAEIWFNWFCFAVIVIAVLAFIIWKKHRSSTQAVEYERRRNEKSRRRTSNVA